MKVIRQAPVDFEVEEQVQAVLTLEMVLQALSSRKIDRKPEGERAWKWYEAWSTTKIEKEAVLQDPAGLEYRVVSTQDWGQGGFYHTELVQQPTGL